MNYKLNEVYRQIPKATCTPGCGKCCGIITPSLAELRNIHDWCQGKHIEFKSFNDVVGLNCPYLTSDKKCQIYPVRPYLCRLLGASIDLPCPLNNTTCDKPLNHAQSRAMYKAIYLKGKEKPRAEKIKRKVRELIGKV